MKNYIVIASVLFGFNGAALYAAPPGNSQEKEGKLCMCMINTWTDYKGNVETIADFAEYSGTASTLDDYREGMMKDRLQKVFDNHLQVWDSYKSGFTASFEGSCSEMRSKMQAEGIKYDSQNTWPVY